MSLRVNTNVSAINTHRNLTINNTEQSKSMERLSSGMKINRGADGPASLVISERLRSQTAGLKQAIDNSEAGISLVQTAEAAFGGYNKLDRMLVHRGAYNEKLEDHIINLKNLYLILKQEKILTQG